MATHDYVVANGTGAAVRSDLNNALAAIVSNNSSSSEPGTTYAYQWWADTNANVLKIRNSSNDGWITLRELDGTMLIEDGSASSPGLAFADDTNTGIFSGSADQINFATAGVERLKIDGTETVFNNPSNDVDFRVESNGQTHMLYINAGNDRIGIGHSSPGVTLDVNGEVRSHHTSSSGFLLEVNDVNRGGFTATTDAGVVVYGASSTNPVRFQTSGSEKARIDTDGRLLVGTSTSPSSGQGQYSNLVALGGAGTTYGNISIGSTSAATSLSSGDNVGVVCFTDNAGNEFVRISSAADAAPGSGDYPGRLVFSTTADGASSPTERMRIASTGRINSSHANNTQCLVVETTLSSGFTSEILTLGFQASAPNNATADFLNCGDTSGVKAQIRSNGGFANFQSNNANLCDEREKKNIASLDDKWDKVKSWDLKKFHYNDDADTDNLRYGVIAQQVEEHCPEVLTNWFKQKAKEAVLDDDGNVVTPAVPEIIRKGIKEQQMMWMAIKALQEAQARIETLEAKVAALEAG